MIVKLKLAKFAWKIKISRVKINDEVQKMLLK